MTILTLDEAKQLLGIEDARDDALLAMWLETLEERIDAHCGRQFAYSAQAVDTFQGGTTALYLSRFPVLSVASVTLDGDALGSDDYVLSAARGRLFYATRDGATPWPIATGAGIVVTYAGGYNTADNAYGSVNGIQAMPGGVRRAAILQLNYEWRNRKQLGVGSISQNGASIQLNPPASLAIKGMTLLPEVDQCLAPYVRRLPA